MNTGFPQSSAAKRREIAGLIEVLRVTDERLDTLLAGQVDTVTDLSGQTHLLRRAQAHVRESEGDKQAAILSALPAHVALLDGRGLIIAVNTAWRRFGEDQALACEAHCVGASYLAWCDSASGAGPQDAALVAQGIQSVLEGSSASFSAEYACHAPLQEHWFLLRVSALADGPAGGAVLMQTDITQRRQDQDALRELNASLETRVRQRTAELNLAREEAEQASQAKSEFLATMSHEIRTPMSGLLGLLELLQLSGLDAGQQSTLAVARNSGSELLHIIDDILDFSKIEARRLELNLVAASVRDVVHDIVRLHSQIASTKNLIVQCEVAPEISPLLSFDPLRLGQILNNFFNNAIKFTERGSVGIRVHLVARSDGLERLRFVVTDTGIGMSSAQLERIFQPFMQAGAETGARFGGTGLGLVISRRLADLMGGTVGIRSVPARGTELTLSIAFEPCEPGPLPAPRRDVDSDMLAAVMKGRRSPPSAAQAEAEGTLLLVVDDHPTNRMVLMRQVASLGYAAQEAGDGAQALAAWKQGRFGAVITDCNMPEMNGYELTRAIRSREKRRHLGRVPIIACTANALPSAAEYCISTGMDDCLVKPANLADLSAKLDRWLPLPRDGKPHAVPARRPASAYALPAPAAGVLDLVLLSAIAGGNPAVQAEIVGDFRRVNEADAVALRSAAVSGDVKRLMHFAHRLRGSSLMLGAIRLAAVCGQMEAAGAQADAAGLHRALDHFETELFRLDRHLDTIAGG